MQTHDYECTCITCYSKQHMRYYRPLSGTAPVLPSGQCDARYVAFKTIQGLLGAGSAEANGLCRSVMRLEVDWLPVHIPCMVYVCFFSAK